MDLFLEDQVGGGDALLVQPRSILTRVKVVGPIVAGALIVLSFRLARFLASGNPPMTSASTMMTAAGPPVADPG